jgi:hypothetical protein
MKLANQSIVSFYHKKPHGLVVRIAVAVLIIGVAILGLQIRRQTAQIVFGQSKPGTATVRLSVRDSMSGSFLASQVTSSVKDHSTMQLSTEEIGRGIYEMATGRQELEVVATGHNSLKTHFETESTSDLNVTIWVDPKEPPDELRPENINSQIRPGYALLHGHLFDSETRSPLVGAHIRLEHGGAEGHTDSRGYFLFYAPIQNLDPSEDVPATDNLIFVSDGFKVYRRNHVTLAEGATHFIIDMKRGDGLTEKDDTHKLMLGREDLENAQNEPPETTDSKATADRVEASDSTVQPLGVTVPSSIRVGFNCSSKTSCTSFQVYSLDTYVKNGLDNEWISSWTSSSLKAGAIAYRTYGVYHVYHPLNVNYDICNTTSCQVNDPTTTAASTDAATDQTSGMIVVDSTGNNPLFSEYASENNDNICADGFTGNNSNWPCMSDSVCAGRAFNGHGRGMCQWGSQRWALNQGKDYVWIVNHYYNNNGNPNGARAGYLQSTSSSLPTNVLSPVVGPLRVTSSNLGIADGRWEFDQHKTGFHRAGGGIGGSNDTYAWDANWYKASDHNADAGQPVYATAEGDVVTYAGVGLPNSCNGVLIAHPNKNSPQWWSGYLHLSNYNVAIGQHVTQDTVIGTVGRSCADNDHLHFVVYQGQNGAGGLISFDAGITERTSAISCNNGSSTNYRNINGGPPLHPNGTLVWSDGSTVWLLQGGQRRWIVSETVLRNLYSQQNGGFDFSDVITISSDELVLYPRGSDVTTALQSNGRSFPDGTIIKDSSGQSYSIITDGGRRRGFATADAFTGLGYAFCKGKTDSNYFTYTEGPPVEAMPLITSSLTISPNGPYFTGNTISGSFTVTNVGRGSVTFNGLLIGGRLNGQVSDFDVSQPRTLSAGQSFTYSGTKNLSSSGTYNFFVAYQDSANFWTTTAPSSAGVSTGTSISVGSNSFRTLTVTSSNPGSGVSIAVNPNDNNNEGSGTTQFARTYNDNASVTLTAPSTANSNSFQGWQRDGSDWSTSLSTSVTMDANHTMTAVYNASTYTITVSSSPSAGGAVSGGGTFAAGSSRTVTAAPNSGYTFTNWTENNTVVSSSVSYTFTLNGNRSLVANFTTNTTRAQITSPANNTTFTSGTVTFNWSPSTGASSYYLYVGNGFQTYDIYSNYVSGGSTTVSGLPVDHRKLYVTMWSLIDGVWQAVNYTYNSCCVDTGGSPAQITSPLNGATFTSGTVTFNWSPSTGASNYYLYVGNSFRTYDIYSNYVSGGSSVVSGLPLDHRKLYVTMWSLINGTWQAVDYTYNSCCETSGTPAQITSPSNGTAFSSGTVTFNWSPSTGASSYYLYIGNASRSYDIYSNYVSGGVTTVSGLPTDSRPLYVTMWSLSNGVWQQVDYVYQAFGGGGGGGFAQITSPTNGATFGSSTVTFNWSPSTGASSYYLYVGNGFRTYDIYSNYVSGGSTTVTGLPTDGRLLYVSMWSLIGGVWQPADYSYRAATVSNGIAQITSPANGSTFNSGTVTFNWSPSTGASSYYLYIGNNFQTYDLYSNYISGGVTTLSGFPRDGRTLYITIWSLINGLWQPVNYTYRACNGCVIGANDRETIAALLGMPRAPLNRMDWDLNPIARP